LCGGGGGRWLTPSECRTNDMSGGRSSIDKSCKTWEGGNTIDGAQPGSIQWRSPVRNN
jgi:hypothetical protein